MVLGGLALKLNPGPVPARFPGLYAPKRQFQFIVTQTRHTSLSPCPKVGETSTEMATQRARSTAGTVRRPITSEEKLRKKVPANRKYNKVTCLPGEIFHRVNRGQLSQLMLTSEYSEEQIQDLPGSARRTVEVNEQDEASKCSQVEELISWRSN
eukprot:689035-Amorphochlora_amoeboformis.AAC.1